MLNCGCAAVAVHQDAHDGLPAGHPSCVVHGCCIVVATPVLAGRLARCAYFSKPVRRSECNYRGDVAGVCWCERPSALDLSFFKYRGPGAPEASERCTCGYFRCAHWPHWRVVLLVDREWFKVGRHVVREAREGQAPDATLAAAWAEGEAERFRHLGPFSIRDETHVYGVTIAGAPERVSNPLKCKTFTPHGPWDFDEFYCGCHGWD